MDKYDYMYLYVIICARGAGTETITINSVTEDDVHIEDKTKAKRELKKYGVFEADCDWADEGFVLGIPLKNKTLPIAGIYKWLVNDQNKLNGDTDNDDAYLSALIRVFLQTPIKGNNNAWTSYNGWRKVSIEVLSEKQFNWLKKELKPITDVTKWECAVMQETCRLAKLNKLPTKDYHGC